MTMTAWEEEEYDSMDVQAVETCNTEFLAINEDNWGNPSYILGKGEGRESDQIVLHEWHFLQN